MKADTKTISILCLILSVFSAICFALTIPWVIARWRGYHLTVELIGSNSANSELLYSLLGTFIAFCALITFIISVLILLLLHRSKKNT